MCIQFMQETVFVLMLYSVSHETSANIAIRVEILGSTYLSGKSVPNIRLSFCPQVLSATS
jgi:hypothetical protein